MASRTLLLVDDEAIIALAQARMLEDYGYSVVRATSGEAAVEHIERGDPIDLVLMDIDLGRGIDGPKAARRILEIRRLPIVFLSAHAEREMVERVREITRYGYVIKNSGDFVILSSIEMAFDLFEAHEEMRRSRAMREAMLANIDDVIAIVDRRGITKYRSPNSARVFGWNAEEVIGRPAGQNIHPDDREEISRVLSDAILHEEGTWHGECRYRCKNDGYRWVEYTAVNRLGDPDINGMLVTLRDISERKRRERELSEQNALISTILESLPIGVAFNHIDSGKVVFMNPAFSRIYGWPEEDLVDVERFFECVYPDPGYRRAIRDRVLTDIESGDPERMQWDEIEVRTRDGERRIIRAVNIPIPEQGIMVSTVSDRTAAVRAKRSLEWQLHFQEIVSDISADVVRTSPREAGAIDRTITRALRRIGELFDADRNFVFLFSADRRTMDNTHEWCAEGIEPQADSLQNVPIDRYSWALGRLRRGEPLVLDDIENLPPEATPELEKFREQKVRSVLAVPLVTGGEVIGYIGLHSVRGKVSWSSDTIAPVRVIAEIVSGAIAHVRADRELRESEQRYRELLEERELLLREVYHRIRNNMSAMKSLLSVKARTLTDERASTVLQEAAAQIQGMITLHEHVRSSTDFREIALDSYLNDLVDAIRNTAPKSVAIDSAVAVESPPVGPEIAFPFGIIVNELVSNSIQHAFPGKRGGSISIRLVPDGDRRLRLEYRDDGIGFPASTGGYTEYPTNGNGRFGLILIRTLVEQMQGALDFPEVESGEGAAVDIVFPVPVSGPRHDTP